MWPAIPPGARLRVRVGGPAPPKVGDIALYLGDDGYTVHRVVSIARDMSGRAYLLTEGDARLAPDPPVACDKVLGAVVAIEIGGQWQPPGPLQADRWLRRLTRACTKAIMIAAMALSVPAARRLAMVLLSLESRARAVVRGAKREATLARMRLGFLVDRIRHPHVMYRKLDVARVNALFPPARRLEVARAVRDSLDEADNDYFRNPTGYNLRYLHLPRGIPVVDDLYPPNMAVLDFLTQRIARPEQEVLLDFPCGIGVLLVYARELGLVHVHGYDNWSYLERATAERFLRQFGVDPAVLVAREDLSDLPVTILTCVGYPFTMAAQISSVWTRPSVRYVLADRMDRPESLTGFRRTTEYPGLLTVFERVA